MEIIELIEIIEKNKDKGILGTMEKVIMKKMGRYVS